MLICILNLYRVIFSEYQEWEDTDEKSIFLLFHQDIGEFIQENQFKIPTTYFTAKI